MIITTLRDGKGAGNWGGVGAVGRYIGLSFKKAFFMKTDFNFSLYLWFVKKSQRVGTAF